MGYLLFVRAFTHFLLYDEFRSIVWIRGCYCKFTDWIFKLSAHQCKNDTFLAKYCSQFSMSESVNLTKCQEVWNGVLEGKQCFPFSRSINIQAWKLDSTFVIVSRVATTEFWLDLQNKGHRNTQRFIAEINSGRMIRRHQTDQSSEGTAGQRKMTPSLSPSASTVLRKRRK